jgi:hypothetical protein
VNFEAIRTRKAVGGGQVEGEEERIYMTRNTAAWPKATVIPKMYSMYYILSQARATRRVKKLEVQEELIYEKRLALPEMKLEVVIPRMAQISNLTKEENSGDGECSEW